jgi:hypothetical protein
MLVGQTVLGQFSPGELSKYHEMLEGRNNCTQCHILGERELSDGCVDCHTPLKEQIKAGKGYHADKPDRCGKCHSDHNGREFELVYWPKDMADFDHDETGYTLTGKHTKLKCADCHTRDSIKGESILRWAEAWKEHAVLDRTFLGLDQTCLGCHADIHAEEVSDDCESCHNTTDWKKAGKNFDHDRARFLLTGAHEKVACEKCHPEQERGTTNVWQLTGMAFDQCGRCHDDVHKGSYGSSCQSCHDTRHWKRNLKPFDHSKTKYPLMGRHTGLDCKKCHTPELTGKLPAFGACVDCHRDSHQGEFAQSSGGIDCGRCHSVFGFLPSRYTLAMHQSTKFPLDGSHLAIPCILCHTKPDPAGDGASRIFHFTDQTCIACHNDQHRGQFAASYNNRCADCHTTLSFQAVSFDHQTTKFPLDGKHENVTCDKCHGTEQDSKGFFTRYAPLPHTCADCHSLTGEIR